MATKKKNQKAATTTETSKPTTKKISGNEFVGRYLISHPEATEDDVKKALTKASLKLNDVAIHAWWKDWQWMVPAMEEAGWKRPS